METTNDELYRKERFSFRFIGLSEDLAAKIRHSLATVTFKSPRSSLPRSAAGLVLAFDLNETMDLTRLYATLTELPVDPSMYSVWISLVTSTDHGGISVPAYVLDLIRRTKCGIDFSFAACLDSTEQMEETGGIASLNLN